MSSLISFEDDAWNISTIYRSLIILGFLDTILDMTNAQNEQI